MGKNVQMEKHLKYQLIVDIIYFEVRNLTERKMRKTLLSSMPLETKRLILRYIEMDDAYDMFEYASLDEVCEYLLWNPHLNIAATEGYIEFLQKRYKKGLYADWAVVLKETGKMIGTCGYASINGKEKTCEIGYVLSPKYQKMGYMTEAVSRMLELSFYTLELNKVVLRIIAENKPSIELARRFGFSYVKSILMDIKDRDREVQYYELTYNDYINKKEAVD